MKKDKEPFDLNIDTLGFYIHRAFYMLIKMLNKELREQNLRIQHSDFAILKVLNEVGGASQSQLASIQGKERSAVSRSLTTLEEEGLIERTPLNGKTNYVTLSEEGKQLIPTLNEIADKITNNALKGISQKTKKGMINNLNKIYQNALLFLSD